MYDGIGRFDVMMGDQVAGVLGSATVFKRYQVDHRDPGG